MWINVTEEMAKAMSDLLETDMDAVGASEALSNANLRLDWEDNDCHDHMVCMAPFALGRSNLFDGEDFRVVRIDARADEVSSIYMLCEAILNEINAECERRIDE